MWRVTFLCGSVSRLFYFPAWSYFISTFHTYCCIHCTYLTALSLFTGTFSQKRVAHTKGVRSLSLGPRDYIPRFPRVPRVRDLLTSSPRMNSKSPTMCSKEKQEYHVPSTAQVRTYSRDFLQSSKSRPLRPQSPVSHTNQRR